MGDQTRFVRSAGANAQLFEFAVDSMSMFAQNKSHIVYTVKSHINYKHKCIYRCAMYYSPNLDIGETISSIKPHARTLTQIMYTMFYTFTPTTRIETRLGRHRRVPERKLTSVCQLTERARVLLTRGVARWRNGLDCTYPLGVCVCVCETKSLSTQAERRTALRRRLRFQRQ